MARHTSRMDRLTLQLDRLDQQVPATRDDDPDVRAMYDEITDPDVQAFILARFDELMGDAPDDATRAHAAHWAYEWMRRDDHDVSMPTLLSWVGPGLPWPTEPPA